LPYLVALAHHLFTFNPILTLVAGLIVSGVFVGGVAFVVAMIVPVFATLPAVSGLI